MSEIVSPTAADILRVRVVDSHTAGEPTRVVVAGGPDLGSGSTAEQLARLRSSFDAFRSAVVNEPRGSDVLVGALIVSPADASCAAGVIFFNNVSYLGMCGHGTIGLMRTLQYLGRIAPGEYRIETPVGAVTTRLDYDGRVSVRNVASYRYASSVSLEVPGVGRVTGDIAYGGNWFFLVDGHGFPLSLEHVDRLTEVTWRIRQALGLQGITGADGAEIDHIELFAPSDSEDTDSRNFVLCPGKAYDRSPCGTGTSAKLACLAADGKLAPGQIWRQAGILGTVFEGWYETTEAGIVPTISGRAWITADATLLLDKTDPLCWGIGAGSAQ